MIGIGTKLKELRTEQALTIDMMIADMNTKYPELRLNKSMLSRWENNMNEPSLEHAKYLSMYFNVSLDYLIGLTDIRTPSKLLAIKQRKRTDNE